MSAAGELVVVVPPELEPGFMLAGVGVRAVGATWEVEDVLDELLIRGEAGVIAIYRPMYEALPGARRQRLERSFRPLVIPLPTGLGEAEARDRRARLVARLQRAVGYRIAFGEGGE